MWSLPPAPGAQPFSISDHRPLQGRVLPKAQLALAFFLCHLTTSLPIPALKTNKQSNPGSCVVSRLELTADGMKEAVLGQLTAHKLRVQICLPFFHPFKNPLIHSVSFRYSAL